MTAQFLRGPRNRARAKVRFAGSIKLRGFDLKRLGIIFLLLTLIACGGGSSEVDFARSLAVHAPADLVLRNGKIITVDRDFSIKEAVAIRDGRFIAVGSDRDVRPLTGPGDAGHRSRRPDGDPGIDRFAYPRDRSGFELGRRAALGVHAHARRRIETNRGGDEEQNRRDSWIVVGGGWVPTQFAERRFPTRAELDAIAPESSGLYPVFAPRRAAQQRGTGGRSASRRQTPIRRAANSNAIRTAAN